MDVIQKIILLCVILNCTNNIKSMMESVELTNEEQASFDNPSTPQNPQSSIPIEAKQNAIASQQQLSQQTPSSFSLASWFGKKPQAQTQVVEKNQLKIDTSNENLNFEQDPAIVNTQTKGITTGLPTIDNSQTTFTSSRTAYTQDGSLATLTYQNTFIKNTPMIQINYDHSSNATSSTINPPTVSVNGHQYLLTKNFLNSSWTSPTITTNASGVPYSFEVYYNPKDSALTTTIVELNNNGKLSKKTVFNISGLQESTTEYDAKGNNISQPLSLFTAARQQGSIAGGLQAFAQHPANQDQLREQGTNIMNSVAAQYGITAHAQTDPEEFKRQALNVAAGKFLPIAQQFLSPPTDSGSTDAQATTPMLTAKNQQGFSDLANQVTQKGIVQVGKMVQDSLNPTTSDGAPENQSSIFNEKTQQTLQQTVADVAATGQKSMISTAQQLIEKQFGQPADPAVIKEQNEAKETAGDQLTLAPLLPITKEEPSSDTGTKSEPVKSDSMLDYLSSTLSQSARKLGKSPIQIKNFLKNIVDTITSFTQLTDAEIIKLDTLAQQETTSLLQDKNSFINADPRTFSKKFSTWLQTFTNKCYSALGRKPSGNLKIISIQTSSESSSPRITLTTNGSKVQSALVTYNQNSYVVDPNLIDLQTDGSIVISKIPLLENGIEPTLYQKANNAFYNASITNTLIQPLKSSSAGKAIGEQAINTASDALQAGKNNPTKLLSLTYTPNKSIIAQETDLNTNINSTKVYDSSGKMLQQNITLPIDPTHIFTPGVDFTYTTNSENDPNKALDVNIDYTNPITTAKSSPTSIKKTYDPQTGVYRIVASYDTPASQQETMQTEIMQKLITNKLIKDGSEQAQQVETILNTIVPIILQYPDKAYVNIVDNFSSILNQSGYTGATINSLVQNTVPKATLQALQDYLKEPIPTSIQSVVIEYSPKTQSIAQRTVTRMSYGNPTQEQKINSLASSPQS